jgi:DHA3 family macrolide efflux protein-like MFS transporter
MEKKFSDWRKTYFLIWSGQAFSLLGSELVQFTLVWYLTRETGSATVLAFASFIALIPRVLLSPFTGALVDRWNRRKIMILADAGIAIVTIILAILFLTNHIAIWHIYAILFIRSLGSAFHWPAMQASTSMMVPSENLSRISGLNQTLRGAIGVISPLLSALLLAVLPIFSVLLIDVGTALLAILPLLFLAVPQPKQPERTMAGDLQQILDDVRSGFKYLLEWKGMFYLTLAAMLLNFLLNPGYSFTPLLVTQYFEKGVLDLSLIETAFSSGMIIGGIILSVWGGFKRNIDTTIAGIIGLAIGTVLVASAPSDEFRIAVVGMALAGFMQPMANGPLFAIMQSKVSPEIQGRIFSLLESMVSAMMPLSMLVAAPVAELIGIRGWLAFGAGGCFIIGILLYLIPAVRNIESLPEK